VKAKTTESHSSTHPLTYLKYWFCDVRKSVSNVL